MLSNVVTLDLVFFSTEPKDWLGRTSAKWPILCRVGIKPYSVQFCLYEYVWIVLHDTVWTWDCTALNFFPSVQCCGFQTKVSKLEYSPIYLATISISTPWHQGLSLGLETLTPRPWHQGLDLDTLAPRPQYWSQIFLRSWQQHCYFGDWKGFWLITSAT